MSFWQFSESSQPLLKRCKELTTFDPNNKWVKKFGHLLPKEKAEGLIEKCDEIVVLSSQDTDTDIREPVVAVKVEIDDDICTEIIESDPVQRFDFIVDNCLNNIRMYSILAKKLPLTSIEKLCEHIFKTNDVNAKFLENFYKLFLPEFMKRENSRASIDIVLKSEKYNGELFKYFLEIITKDTGLPNHVFQQYISVLNDKNQLDALKSIISFDISNDVFIHHLHSINILYKNCIKTEDLQKYILAKLSSTSKLCVNDKNYGRLLLNYLQAQKNFDLNLTMLQKIIDIHRSPFKKPCLNMFNELKRKVDQSLL